MFIKFVIVIFRIFLNLAISQIIKVVASHTRSQIQQISLLSNIAIQRIITQVIVTITETDFHLLIK